MAMTEGEIEALGKMMQQVADRLSELGASDVLILCSVDTEKGTSRGMSSGRGNPFTRDGLALRYAMDGVGDE